MPPRIKPAWACSLKSIPKAATQSHRLEGNFDRQIRALQQQLTRQEHQKNELQQQLRSVQQENQQLYSSLSLERSKLQESVAQNASCIKIEEDCTRLLKENALLKETLRNKLQAAERSGLFDLQSHDGAKRAIAIISNRVGQGLAASVLASVFSRVNSKRVSTEEIVKFDWQNQVTEAGVEDKVDLAGNEQNSFLFVYFMQQVLASQLGTSSSVVVQKIIKGISQTLSVRLVLSMCPLPPICSIITH